ncbi:MAG: hypothetical protein ACOVO1_13520 [Chitinophagaceae bacterium]
MAKFITSIFLTALLAFAIGLFEFPWWSFAITTLVIFAAIPQPPAKSFLAAFLSIFVLWFAVAAKLDFANEHLLSKKVASIILKNESYFLLLLITAFIGALIAGMSALTGSLLRKCIGDLVTK